MLYVLYYPMGHTLVKKENGIYILLINVNLNFKERVNF